MAPTVFTRDPGPRSASEACDMPMPVQNQCQAVKPSVIGTLRLKAQEKRGKARQDLAMADGLDQLADYLSSHHQPRPTEAEDALLNLLWGRP